MFNKAPILETLIQQEVKLEWTSLNANDGQFIEQREASFKMLPFVNFCQQCSTRFLSLGYRPCTCHRLVVY